ncbi:PAS domain-containing protein [Sphingomonas lutea]|uniref:histidine kinase n=1 Tax=Sphingomonas lutea TaxID=1045317 RepID=A0A7G9SJJ7_9SPHN|nr:PAS domain-containing sensor histidine kinase [Sphingomonas lutea]QNN68022.1 PAS domain-containing protein [Sphingomonas lutea]
MPQTLGILASTGRDGAVIANILERSLIDVVPCATAEELLDALERSRVGGIIVAEEAFRQADLERLTEWLTRQHSWSDLPVILLTRKSANSAAQMSLAQSLGNTTILERPLFPATLVSAARAALRARRKQHEAEEQIAQLAARELELSQERARLAASELRLREANEKLGQRFAEALSEKRVLADIVEGTDAFVQVADLNYRWLAINRAARDEFERIFGVRPQIGDSMLDVLDHAPEHRKAVQAAWGRALAGEEYTEVGEFGDPSRDRRHYEMKFNTLYDERGERIGAYQFVHDVTERVENQRRLSEAQNRVHEMAKLETLGQLTGGVAHDFNNLLTPIVGALDLLHRKHEGDERARRLISGALQASERASILVQRLLSFARRQHLEARAINVGELIEGIRDLLQRSIGPHVHVDVEIENQLPAAKIDPNQLELALLNLAVNASDAMSGGGRLSIKVETREIGDQQVDELKAGRYIRLSVSDTGTGMDDATLQRAIEPFFTTKGPGEGTGLGLSMVHGLAAQSGGTLNVVSAPGKGTTAEIWLPVFDGDADVLVGAESEVAHQPRQTAILLVDDEDVVRRATADMLLEIGHEVLQANSGSAALKILAERPDIEILVTDYLMPGMRGAELVNRAREMRPGMKALLITGYARMTGGQAEIARLAKPFRAADLAREIAKLLSEGKVVDLAAHGKRRPK